MGICIIWDYQKEGMFCSTCGKIVLHLMADRKCTRQKSCLPKDCGQGDFRCPQLKQLSVLLLSFQCQSDISEVFLSR